MDAPRLSAQQLAERLQPALSPWARIPAVVALVAGCRAGIFVAAQWWTSRDRCRAVPQLAFALFTVFCLLWACYGGLAAHPPGAPPTPVGRVHDRGLCRRGAGSGGLTADAHRADPCLRPTAGSAQSRVLRPGQAGIPRGQQVDRLSGGHRTLVTLALAVGNQADLLVLDEPREPETTMLRSSHIVADFAEICDHLILLDGGRVKLCGSITDLLDTHPRDHLGGTGVAPPAHPGIVQ
jgi:hypothetical protein